MSTEGNASAATTTGVGGLITFFTASVYQYQFRLWRLTGPVPSRGVGCGGKSEVAAAEVVVVLVAGSVDCVTLMPSITPSFPILGLSAVPQRRVSAGEAVGIKARKSSVSKMNGSGIDDARRRARAGALVGAGARESIEKFAGKKSASGSRKIANGPFIFIWALLLLAPTEKRERERERKDERERAKARGREMRARQYLDFIRDKEFMLANGIPDYSSRCARQRYK